MAAPGSSSDNATDADGFWEQVPTDGAILKGSIDDNAAAGDCDSLQLTYDTWEQGNFDSDVKASLLTYIDNAKATAGCA